MINVLHDVCTGLMYLAGIGFFGFCAAELFIAIIKRMGGKK